MADGTLLDSIGLFLSLLGDGISIESIFATGGLDLQRMLDKLEFEIKQVFLDDLSDQSVYEATGVAQASADWLSTNYVNAVNSGETKAELWAMLSQDASGPRLSDLVAQASTMLEWAKDHPKAIAQKTTSLALTIYGLIVALYRERSANAPDQATQAAEAANMCAYAAMGVQRIDPLFQSISTSRLYGISEVQAGTDSGLAQVLYVTDAWLADFDSSAPAELSVWVGNIEVSPTPDAQTQIGAASAAYVQLLQTGSDDAAAALKASLGDAFTGDTPAGFPDSPNAAGIIAQIPSFQTTGKWLNQAPDALQNLRKIAGAPSGYAAVYTRRTLPGAWDPGTDLAIMDSHTILTVAAAYDAEFSAHYAFSSSDGSFLHSIHDEIDSPPWDDPGNIFSQLDISPMQVEKIAAAGGNTMSVQFAFTAEIGHLWHTIRNGDGSWQQAGDLSGTIGLTRVSGIAAADGPADGEAEFLFIKGVDGTLWHTIRRTDGSWDDLGDVNGVIGSAGTVKSIAGCRGSDTKSHWIILNDVGEVYYTARNPDGSWIGLTDLGSKFSLGGPVNAVARWDTSGSIRSTT